MKKTNSFRIMALALAACIMLGLCVFPKAEAALPKWTKFDTGSGTLDVDTTIPSNLSVVGGQTKANYDKKIDVVEGTKIAFKVQFTNLVDNANLHYGFALTDAPGGYWTDGTKPNSIELELVSTVTGGGNGNLQATPTKMTAGGTRKAFAAMTTALASPRNNTDIYDVTFEKINETVGSVSYTWKLTVSKAGGTVYTHRYLATEVSNNLFANGAYFTVANMGGGAHTVKVSNLKITQPNTTSQWKTVANNSIGRLTLDSDNSFDATFENYVTGNYNQKIDVKEGTTVSFRVTFPRLTDGLLLQYGFALVDDPNSFYTSNNTANNMYLELSNVPAQGTALKASAAYKRKGETSRTTAGDITAGLAQVRNTEDIYEVSFKKINETESGVNYSWSLTVRKYNAAGTTDYKAYRYTAEQISHDMFANGAYFAMGSLASSSTHCVKVTDFMVNNSWTTIASANGVVHDVRTESADSFNASFRNIATGYYNRKIEVVEGTKISMKVKPIALKTATDMHFGVYLANAPEYFGDVGSGNALGVEVTSLSGNNYALRALVCTRTPVRDYYENDVLSQKKDAATAYTLTFEKLPAAEANSWKVTIANGATVVREQLVEDTTIPDDMFNNGLYISAGALNSSAGHTMNLFDLQITRPDAEASVGGVPYGDVLDAVQAADGETVTLVKDLDLTEELDLTGKDVTLDLDGNTISGAEQLTLGEGTNLTLKGGELEGKLTLADNGATITADCDLALELDGKTATVNASNVALTDTATDNGEEGGKVYGKLTAAEVTKENGISYVALSGQDEGGKYYTANAVRAKLKRVNIRPAAAGVYFTTNFTFNKNVADAIAAAVQDGEYCGYGVVVSIHSPIGADFITEKDGDRLVNMWTKSTPDAGEAFINSGNSALITNILSTNEAVSAAENAARGAIDIYANAYVKIGDTVIMAENSNPVTMSLKSVMQTFDTKLGNNELDTDTTEKLVKFYTDWKETMDHWNLTNLFNTVQ